MKSKRNDINIADECKRLMNFHVMLFLKDGIKLDGIIQDINEEGVLVLVATTYIMPYSYYTPFFLF